jgi:hypothetical protein
MTNLNHLGSTARMGPILQKEVESQLLNDLRSYGIEPSGLVIDWSDACQEGHCTQVLDGNLEDLSSVGVTTLDGNVVAEGWMDFIHGGGENPLFVFWLFLHVFRNGERHDVKNKPHIPEHIWSRLPEATKRICTNITEYDARWKNDPLVVYWRSTNDA